MLISVASGKGGTGKTTVAVSLALSLDNIQLLDCDVEEPNAHIFFQPEFKQTKPVKVIIPLVDDEKCTRCGICAEVCEFNALAVVPKEVLFFAELCHNCGACQELCPEEAISPDAVPIGEINLGKTASGIDFVNGVLAIGQPRAIPIIQEVKEQIDPEKITIIDAPPGTSCTVIESIEGSDYCILVTEPTPFGLWDLKITVEVLRALKIPFGVILNRYGIGNDNSVEEFCQKGGIEILMTIPFDRSIAEAYSKGIALVDFYPEWREKFKQLYQTIQEELKK